MDVFDQQEVLKTFEILIDTREQDTARARKRYKAFGAPYRRATLSYGDYTYSAVLPGSKPLYDESHAISAPCVIERKMDLTELSACFTHGRDRFRREFQRAAEHDARIFLIVENASWENLMNGKYRTRFNANAYFASMTAYMVRYNMNVIFCKEESSGRIIKEILYRDLKERLERGEYG